MDELILGLLNIRDMTTYDIKKSIQNGMNFISSDSMGSIHTSLKKLLLKELICFEERVEDNKFKKIYSLTDSGITFFKEWIDSASISNKYRNPELKKIFFMGFSNKEASIIRIKDYISKLKEEEQSLNDIKSSSLIMMDSLTDDKKEIATFQIETINYGIDFMSFEIEWYQKFLNRLESK